MTEYDKETILDSSEAKADSRRAEKKSLLMAAVCTVLCLTGDMLHGAFGAVCTW